MLVNVNNNVKHIKPVKNKLKLDEIEVKEEMMRDEVKGMIKASKLPVESSDTNYIFIRFVMDHMPHGLIGLLIAVIFLAAWGSISAALNSLSASSLIDFHRLGGQTLIDHNA